MSTCLHNDTATDVLACVDSYRGYRLNDKLKSGGAPYEAGLKQDTQAALDFLLARPDVNPKQVSLLSAQLTGMISFFHSPCVLAVSPLIVGLSICQLELLQTHVCMHKMSVSS